MKIQCDVCNENEAAVYCSADEAALCSACDHNVHHANKLAGKHPRFSLIHPKDSTAVMCDICQEKKAFLFCQQDRAILCKDCDSAIHKLNQQKQNHNRFLLTGVKLSPTETIYSPPTIPTTTKKQVVSPVINQTQVKVDDFNLQVNGSGHRSGSDTSSISEYLIDMLPGWHVEDFLDSPPNFSKVVDNDPAMIWGGDSFSPESMGIWVPQAPPPVAKPSTESMGIWVPQAPPPVAKPSPAPARHVQQFEPSSNIGFGDQIINGVFAPNNFKTMTKSTKSSRKWTSDDGSCFTVPQISPQSTASKRSRNLWN